MSGISDLDQPAKQWISDAICSLGELVEQGGAPSMDIEAFGLVFEFRLKSAPGNQLPISPER